VLQQAEEAAAAEPEPELVPSLAPGGGVPYAGTGRELRELGEARAAPPAALDPAHGRTR
jgi:hypothetical protein